MRGLRHKGAPPNYGTPRVDFSGIKFFYTRICRRDWRTLATMKLRNVKSLSEVLTTSQVH